MPSTIGKCKLFRIKHITVLEGETFLRNKHKTDFFGIKCIFFGRKENTITLYMSDGPYSLKSIPNSRFLGKFFMPIFVVLSEFLP